MPHRVLPNSLPTAIRCLKKARDQWVLTAAPAERALNAEHWAKLNPDPALNPPSFLNRLLKETAEVDIALGAQGTATDHFNAARKRAATLVSHFYQVYDLGVARGLYAAAARSYYGRSITDTAIPATDTEDDLADALDALLKGETDRQTAEGTAFVPMSNPTAAEVATVRTQFLNLRAPKKLALEKTDREREEASALLPEALDLCKDIYDTVEYFFRKEADDASRRKKCERWGLTYHFDPSEQPAPPPDPNPAPTPAPGPNP